MDAIFLNYGTQYNRYAGIPTLVEGLVLLKVSVLPEKVCFMPSLGACLKHVFELCSLPSRTADLGIAWPTLQASARARSPENQARACARSGRP